MSCPVKPHQGVQKSNDVAEAALSGEKELTAVPPDRFDDLLGTWMTRK